MATRQQIQIETQRLNQVRFTAKYLSDLKQKVVEGSAVGGGDRAGHGGSSGGGGEEPDLNTTLDGVSLHALLFHMYDACDVCVRGASQRHGAVKTQMMLLSAIRCVCFHSRDAFVLTPWYVLRSIDLTLPPRRPSPCLHLQHQDYRPT